MIAANASAGRPPDLEYLPVAALTVDRTYQRSTDSARSKRLIEKIAANFKWAHFQAIIATPRGKGKYAIVDGQHRVEAAKRRGLARVPAVVIDAAGAAEAAEAFIAANRDRVNVNALQIHHASLAAGNPEAQAVARVCRDAGVTLLRYPVHARQMKPGQTMALGAIRRTIVEHGEDAATAALRLVARAAQAKPGGIRAPFIRGVAALRQRRGAPDSAIVRVLAAASHAKLLAAAQDRALPGGVVAGLIEEIGARAAKLPKPDPERELARAIAAIEANGLKVTSAGDGTYRVGEDAGYTPETLIEVAAVWADAGE